MTIVCVCGGGGGCIKNHRQSRRFGLCELNMKGCGARHLAKRTTDQNRRLKLVLASLVLASHVPDRYHQ